MNVTLKVLSLLLSYPTAELQQAVPAMKAALADEPAAVRANAAPLCELADAIAVLDLYEAQERYVHLFDRTRSLSLHLFEHVHGEGRDRGQAMVDLMATYEQHGYEIDARELPDHLPLFLEFLSLLPEREAADLLGQIAHITAMLKERLAKRDSVYAVAFAVLEALGRGPDGNSVEALLGQPEDNPDDLAALDRLWEEEAVTFGGNAGENPCGPDRLRMQMRAAARRPADAAAVNP